ncbi:MAG: hypothetical protein GY913_03280 [Proteobacteria bacterium]|nr:hypothetical protein [Pseudomonadota bacterium]MCP4915923.1 hypothetical protein [Pseudomonadota bacterium]
MIQRAIDTVTFLAGDPIGKARSGETPHTVIHRQGPASLRYFAPDVATGTPLFVSMPLINTWTIWDLLPQRSIVRRLVDAGHPVYLLDWGKPGPEHADRPLTYYVDDLLGRAIARAHRHAGQDLAAAGYCVGGTFLASHLARNTPPAITRVAFVATPVDFHQSGRLARWADPAAFPLEALQGNFPGSRMRSSFALLKPTGQTRKWFSLSQRIEDAGFRELWAHLEAWSGDEVDFPGEAYRGYIQSCYFDNALKETLGSATVPATSIAAATDHIVPPPAAHALADHWGGPVTTTTIKGGHVGICVGKALPAALLEFLA